MSLQATILLWSVLQRRRSFFRPYTPFGFLIDFLLNAGGILVAITAYADTPLLLNGLLVGMALFVVALPRDVDEPRSRKVAKKPKAARDKDGKAAGMPLSTALPKKAFLTTYRGAMMVVTCLAILAVDFRIFPRRFAKVETWGTSLMDMGVGSFVFSAGVVAARSVLKERAAGRVTPLGPRLLTSLRHALPLLVLGVVRLISVKGLDYAEHVTEYGVHWNFFFTLGLLPPFVAVSQSALQVVPSSAALALLLSGVYQVALETTSLKAYVLTAPRVDLVSKNREGLASFIGYLAIFLAGQDTGMYLLPRSAPSTAKPAKSSKSKSTSAWLWQTIRANPLPAWAVTWWVLHQLAIGVPYGLGLTESRRIANLPYVLWVLSFNTQQLSMFYLVDKYVFGEVPAAADAEEEAAAHDEATSLVLRAYNRNGLVVFLLANLLTGLVNLTVPTLDVTRPVASSILFAYAGVITAVAVTLEVYGITVKL